MALSIRPDSLALRTLQVAERPSLGGGTDAADGSFADLLKKAVGDASDMQTDAQSMIGAFLRGEPVELHQVMAASQEAQISLELLVEIRNKLTDAYRTVMNLQ